MGQEEASTATQIQYGRSRVQKWTKMTFEGRSGERKELVSPMAVVDQGNGVIGRLVHCFSLLALQFTCPSVYLLERISFSIDTVWVSCEWK